MGSVKSCSIPLLERNISPYNEDRSDAHDVRAPILPFSTFAQFLGAEPEANWLVRYIMRLVTCGSGSLTNVCAWPLNSNEDST